MKKIIILGVAILVLVGCSNKKYIKLETELTEKATKYYHNYIEVVEQSFSLNEHKITLEALSTAGIDISNFDKKNCDKESYSLIILNLNAEGEPEGDFIVENHLTCKKYKTKKD
jgi:uncharacterized protein YcfL